MRSSHLPGKLPLLFLCFVLGPCLISGCTSRRNAPFIDQHPSPRDVLDINVATAEQLQELPTVGASLAQKIIDHRKRYGKFRRPEHLLVIDGVSEKRFRAFREYIDTK